MVPLLLTLIPFTLSQSILNCILVDGGTALDVAQLPGATNTVGVTSITLPRLNMRCDADALTDSVRFSVSGGTLAAELQSRTENVVPFAAFGDDAGTYSTVWNPSYNIAYSFTATPFSADNAEGTAGTARVLTVTLTPPTTTTTTSTTTTTTTTTTTATSPPVPTAPLVTAAGGGLYEMKNCADSLAGTEGCECLRGSACYPPYSCVVNALSDQVCACLQGSYGCPCFSDATCDEGIACLPAGVCEPDPNPPSPGQGSASSSDGDEAAGGGGVPAWFPAVVATIAVLILILCFLTYWFFVRESPSTARPYAYNNHGGGGGGGGGRDGWVRHGRDGPRGTGETHTGRWRWRHWST
mmetsp:Transcript_12873/g.40654  ORF Transcript_12873/g.40654 Transcript_12873/m.40654 type:complete len:354 (-) Transcript_12873:60-1121(-)